ncbi:MAG: energy transducer TonB [Bacteroidales bacterium]|nr:energy transducer TonB [Bacteroidales bacterium]
MKKLFLIMFFMAFVSVNAYSQSDDSDNEVYSMVDERAQFPGGQNEMLKYLQENLQYPEAAKANNVHGRVIVKFIVERDGSLSDIKVMKGIGSGCNEEAIRLIQSMPKWKPGKNKGKEVRVSMMVPVNF